MTPGEMRDYVWAELMREGEAVYPLPPHGHHPNFRGAKQAATHLLEHLLSSHMLTPGDTVLAYPDYVLKPLRKGALEAGINLVVPKQHKNGFLLLERSVLAADKVAVGKVVTIAGAERHGLELDTLPPCRLVFLACVGLDPAGYVLDKGYGFRVPKACRHLPLVSVVHPVQLLKESLAAPFEGLLRVCRYATPTAVSEPKGVGHN